MTDAQSLTRLLHRRRTHKALAEVGYAPSNGDVHRDALDTLLADAAMAPFHYPHPRHEADGTAVPWRVSKLGGPACRALATRAEDADVPIGSVARMLRAADALLLIWTTLEGASENGAFVGSERNMEHIAATGAFTQNLLLAATAAGHETYWSSGGVLRGSPVTDWLDVPEGDLLVGAIFLFPTESGTALVKPGKWRDARGTVADWSVWKDA